MTAAFVRQLGAESGVQLNPLRDESALPAQSISDQVFAIPMRATRGHIDRAFKVHEGNVQKKLGRGEPTRLNAINEAMVHVIEGVRNGGYEAVVSRLVTSAAKIKWAVCKVTPATEGAPEAIAFTVVDEAPESDFLFAVKHLECFNDGIKLAFRAESATSGGIEQAVSVITLRLTDKDGEVIHEYTGSLKQDARDDNGNPFWLPDVVSQLTTDLEVLATVNGQIEPASAAYGETDVGTARWATSGVLQCFDEGGTGYTMDDYVAACKRLQFTPHNYAYISSGGTRAPALFAQLAQLAYNTNRQLKFDIPGDMKPEQAVAFLEQINMTGQKEAHLLHAYWSPLKSMDPTGINGKGFFGVATLNIAYACARNAQVDANGFAPKNYVVAGKLYPINRQGITQAYTPDNKELSMLAKAKINVVCAEEFSDGTRYVFRDSLTCAPVSNSLKMLISVADMACHTDDFVTRLCKDALQLPMDAAIKTINDALKKYYEGAEAAKWIKPSSDPDMKGMAARWSVRPSEARPYDAVVVEYGSRYDGTARAMFATQTIKK